MKLKLLKALLLSVVCLTAFSQQIFKAGVHDGLSSNYVNNITQDRNGYIWFATSDGLTCFDGTKYTSFFHKRAADANSLSGDALNVVFADPEEPIIWVGTQRYGLDAYHYEEGRFEIYQHRHGDNSSLITNDVTNIVDGGPGKLWVSTYWRGIELLDKKSGQFTHYNQTNVRGMTSDSYWCMAYDQKDKLYLGGVNSGLTILDVRRRTARNFQRGAVGQPMLPCDEILSLYLDTYGQLWVGSHDGLKIYDTNRDQFIDLTYSGLPKALMGNKFLSIRPVGDEIWLSVEFDGVYRLKDVKFDGQSIAPFHVTRYAQGFRKDMLSCSAVHDICGDRFGNIWLGTWGGGVNFISHIPPMFENIEYGDGVSSDEYLTERNVLGVAAVGSDYLYACPEGGGINVFKNGHRVEVMTKENGRIPDNVVMTAFRDSKDNVWFGTYDGWVYKLNAHTGSMQKERLPMGAGSFSVIFRFYEDSKGRMFVGTNYGFFILDAATMAVKARYDERNSPLPEPYIRSICQDWHGRYWVGTFGSGLTILTSDMKLVKQFWVSKGASSNTINQIVAGKNDKIWVATGDGVMCFDASNLNRSKCYNETNGLLNCKVHSLAQDAQGNVWVGTNRGLSCIVPTKGKVYNYANIDNIGNGEFNDGSVTADSQGKLYFGYNGGIFGFNPSNIKEHYRLPPIGFTNLEVRQGFQGKANRILYLANQKTVDLDYDENTFTVGFNVRDNALNGSVYYAYRVKELSDSWYEIGHDQQVTFRNLPHGTYTMEVKARINDKDWSGPETSVAICIAPPFWLSWWAKTIYILLALGVVVLIFYAYRNYLLRLNQLQMEKSSRKKETEMNNERLRFYTNIAHELRTPLTLVIGPLDDLLRGGTLTDIVRHQVEMISKNANRLLGLVNQIMEFRKTETQNRKLKVARQNLSEVVTEELLKFKEANKNPNLVFDLDLSDKNITLYFDKEVISIILDNLLSNSVKYTPSGSIMITVNARPSAVPPVVDISVIDTGYGIAPEAIPHLFERYYQAGGEHQVSGTGIGLALVRSLSDLHQGTLNVRSKVGEGTAITFSLQMENTYPDAEHAVAAAESPKLPTCDDEPSVQKETVSGSEEPDEGHLLILVVEDNPDIAAYIKDSFEDTYDVVTAENGKEGEEQAFKLTPDIIVSDIMMPVMDGIEMCQTLKNDIRTSHIPIILLTAKDSMLNKEEGYLAGADSYITKPFSSSLLLSRINNLLENRRRQAKQVTTAQLNDKKEQLNVFANQHDNEFIKRVTDIIKQNISEEKLDIGFVAEHMNMSISSLYRKMKALTGQSTNEFIRKIRMGTAEELLLRHDLSISDVAYKVGFSSLSYFRQCFKEVYGSSPSDYIKKITDQ